MRACVCVWGGGTGGGGGRTREQACKCLWPEAQIGFHEEEEDRPETIVCIEDHLTALIICSCCLRREVTALDRCHGAERDTTTEV